jgi:hypothetical protein
MVGFYKALSRPMESIGLTHPLNLSNHTAAEGSNQEKCSIFKAMPIIYSTVQFAIPVTKTLPSEVEKRNICKKHPRI